VKNGFSHDVRIEPVKARIAEGKHMPASAVLDNIHMYVG